MRSSNHHRDGLPNSWILMLLKTVAIVTVKVSYVFHNATFGMLLILGASLRNL